MTRSTTLCTPKDCGPPITAKRTEIVHSMQQIEYDTGGYIIPYFPPVIDGYSTKVQGVKPSRTGVSFNNWDLKSRLVFVSRDECRL